MTRRQNAPLYERRQIELSDSLPEFNVALDHDDRPLMADVLTVGQPDTVVFLGIGNENRCIDRLAGLLADQGISDVAIVAPLPYERVESSQRNLQDFALIGAITVGRYLKQAYPNMTRLHAVAESQAVPSLVHAALADPKLFDGRIELLHPLGIVPRSTWFFASRMMIGNLQREQLDWRVWPVFRWASWRTLEDLMDGGERLRNGLSIDIRQELQELAEAKGGDLRVMGAERDLIFPPDDLRRGLADIGLERLLAIEPGSHSSPCIKAGSRHVARAVAWCRSEADGSDAVS